MSTNAPTIEPAHMLAGLTLPNTGWKIVKELPQGATGGNFGVGYFAERGDGAGGIESAFVKAIDFVDALSRPDPLKHLSLLVSLAQYESEINDFCTSTGMTKVIRSLGKDEIIPPCFSNDPTRRVFCIILERGEGDLRKKLTTISAPPLSWKLAILRDVALAISQMHKGELAHQDIKPSNVITLPDISGEPQSKLGDLGRAVRKSGGPYNAEPWPGQKSYMPIERRYGFRPSDWIDEREASDAFMLGGLILFLFTGTPLLISLIDGLPDNLKPGTWRSGYDSTVRAALLKVHVELIENTLRPTIPKFSDEICDLTYWLTHPEPEKRGDKRARGQKLVGVDRTWSKLRLLAEKARINGL